MKDRDPDVMSARDAAALLGLSINTVYELVGRQEIPHRRIGRTIRFSRPALLRWLEGDRKAG